MMGLPIAQLVVATNENDVLDEFFRTGTYRVRGSAETFETSSPSMDISKASNFERFVFDLLGPRRRAHARAVRRGAAARRRVHAVGRREGAHRRLRLRLGPQHARRPPGHDPRHRRALRRRHRHPHGRRPEGGARARAAGRADARAGDGAADQVRRHDRGGAGPQARAARGAGRPRVAAEAVHRIKADVGGVKAFVEGRSSRQHAPAGADSAGRRQARPPATAVPDPRRWPRREPGSGQACVHPGYSVDQRSSRDRGGGPDPCVPRCHPCCIIGVP